MHVTWPNCEQIQPSDDTSPHLLPTVKHFTPFSEFVFSSNLIRYSIVLIKYISTLRSKAIVVQFHEVFRVAEAKASSALGW
jgi:hypothetical protein